MATIITDTLFTITGAISVAKSFSSTKVIDNAVVSPGGIVTGSTVRIAFYETKTVTGKSEFDGKLHIDVSPSGTTNFLQDIYVVNISSGVTFSASFTEVFDYMVVRVENTSTTTGIVNVWVDMLG